MSETLKPCPFCPELVACPERDQGGWIIVCNREAGGCGASTAIYHREAEAIAAWNRRAPSPHGQDVEAGPYAFRVSRERYELWLAFRDACRDLLGCAIETKKYPFKHTSENVWLITVEGELVRRAVEACKALTREMPTPVALRSRQEPEL